MELEALSNLANHAPSRCFAINFLGSVPSRCAFTQQTTTASQTCQTCTAPGPPTYPPGAQPAARRPALPRLLPILPRHALCLQWWKSGRRKKPGVAGQLGRGWCEHGPIRLPPAACRASFTRPNPPPCHVRAPVKGPAAPPRRPEACGSAQPPQHACLSLTPSQLPVALDRSRVCVSPLAVLPSCIPYRSGMESPTTKTAGAGAGGGRVICSCESSLEGTHLAPASQMASRAGWVEDASWTLDTEQCGNTSCCRLYNQHSHSSTALGPG